MFFHKCPNFFFVEPNINQNDGLPISKLCEGVQRWQHCQQNLFPNVWLPSEWDINIRAVKHLAVF